MTELVRQWSVETGGRIQHSTPTIGEEFVFVDSLDPTFYALSREDGSVAWSRPRDGSLSDSAPVYHDGRVYVGSGGGSVHAFDPRTGDELWTFEGDSAIVASPALLGDTVYVGRNDGDVLALDAEDGSVEWRVGLDAAIYADLAVSAGEDAILVGTRAGRVCALDATDGGRAVWSRNFAADVDSSTPVVDDERGLVYVAANEVMALDVDSGDPAWVTGFYGTNAGSSPVFDDDTVYVGGANGNVYAMGCDGPTVRTTPEWSFRRRSTVAADPALVDDALVVGTMDGDLCVLESASGDPLAETALEGKVRTAVAVSAAEVYVGMRDGTVHSFAIE